MIRASFKSVILAAALAGTMPQMALAQPAEARAETPLPSAHSRAVVASLIRELNRRYVFPDKATLMEEALRQHERRGAYVGLSGTKLATLLTEQLQAVTGDRHLQVEYSDQPLPPVDNPGGRSAAQKAEELALIKSLNYGVERVERLPFNIGYLDLRGFAPADQAGPAIAAAMTLLANTDALIIDLRQNGGGEPDGVALLASYFFDRTTHLVDTYYREGNRTEQGWTAKVSGGPRYGTQRDVYVLTGKRTFSAAESFSYALKNLKRATIVGEGTGGGAQPGDFVRIDPQFEVFIPNGRSISPITNTNWEGVGVAPDVVAAEDTALEAAQLLVLRKLLVVEKDDRRAKRLKARIDTIEAASPEPAGR